MQVSPNTNDTPLGLSHFREMLGQYGIYQHANNFSPNLQEGYCVDDNARAVLVLIPWIQQSPADAPQLEIFLDRCFQFVVDAEYAPGAYYNFRDDNGVWLTHDISEDMYARIARMYAHVISRDANADRITASKQSLTHLVPTLASLTATRALAETIIAIRSLPATFCDSNPEFARIAQAHTATLLDMWGSASSPDWQWFEPAMTYANAILPHGILMSNHALSERVTACMHACTKFLLSTTIQNAIFMPVGNKGWYTKGGTPAQYDQQPIEAGTMFEFLLAYQAKFPDKISKEQLLAPYLWFLGRNTDRTVMANTTIGSCFDGLEKTGPNPNCGAESTLAYLSAELAYRRLKP